MCSPSSEPLPVHSAHILDYKESPETGVVFDMEPPAGTIFSRVNITFTEGEERRSMLYKGTQVLKVLPENLSGFSDTSKSSNRKCQKALIFTLDSITCPSGHFQPGGVT